MMTNRRLNSTRTLGLFSILTALVLVLASCAGEPELIGTDMEGEAAPPFTLTDHRGETVNLEDLEGRAVALTFIFTNCPDVCPLIMSRMKAAYDEIPEDKQDDVAMVAITVDPDRDDADAMREYLADRDVAELDNWYGLTGDYATLEPIWEGYYVTPGEEYPADPDVLADMESGEHDPEEYMESTPGVETDDDHGHEGHSMEEDENTAYWLAHTDVIYVLDPENNLRRLMRSDATPDDIAHNLEVLAP